MIRKYITRLVTIILLMVCLVPAMQAQQDTDVNSYPKSVKAKLKKGDKISVSQKTSDEIKKYAYARYNYKKAYDKDTSLLPSTYRYAYMTLKLKDTSCLDWAIATLWDIATNNPSANDTLWYELGRIYMEKWLAAQDLHSPVVNKIYMDSALKCLDNQLAFSNRQDYVERVQKAKKELENAEQAVLNKELGKGVQNFEKINSEFDDFNPQFTEKEKKILFSSFRKNKNRDVYGAGGSFIFDREDSTVTFTNNYKTSLMTSNRYNPNAFFTNFGGNVFEYNEQIKGRRRIERPVKAINSKQFIELNATYAEDGNTIYFASNCPEGFYSLSAKERKKVAANQAKDFDIYKITRTLQPAKKEGKPQKEEWGTPEKLPAPVNTKYDELQFAQHIAEDMSPIYYLISNNENSIGGYDIFSTVQAGSSFAEPTNMGFPINSTADEISFLVSASGADLFLTSDRINGLGCKDIYYIKLFEREQYMPIACWADSSQSSTATIDTNGVRGVILITKVIDEETGNILPGTSINLEADVTDLDYIPESLLPYISDGVAQVPEEVIPHLLGINERVPDSLVSLVSVLLTDNATMPDSLKNYFLTTLLKKNTNLPNKVAALVKNNKPLPDTLQNYLIASLLLADNNVPEDLKSQIPMMLANNQQIPDTLRPYLVGAIIDGNNDVPVDLQKQIAAILNGDVPKRKILTLTAIANEEGKAVFVVPEGAIFDALLKKKTYLDTEDSVAIPYGYAEVYKTFVMRRLTTGAIFVLKNIFYDYDKYNLRQASVTELERLVQLMNEYPNMEIEIRGHCDIKGTDRYNITLSNNRAKVVVNWLVAHGIAKERLTYKGYSFHKPIATNETDEGRQLNRRTEFKITKIK